MGQSMDQDNYNRDNYARWPWTAILIVCTVSGILFLMAGVPRGTGKTTAAGLAVTVIFTALGIAVLIPVVVTVPVYLAYKIFRAFDKEVPQCCRILEPLMAKNRRVKESVHFYEHPAGTLRAGLQSSVYVVRMHRPSVRPGTSGQSDAQAKTDFLMRLSAAGQAQPSGLVDIPPDIPAQYCQGLAPYSSYAREVGYQPSKAGASYDGQNPSGSGSTGHHGPSRQSSQPSGPRMQSNEVLRQSGRPQIRPAAPPAQFGSGAGVVRPPPPYRPRPPPPPYRPQTSPRAPQPSGQPRHPGPGQHTAAPSVYHTGNDAQNTRPAKPKRQHPPQVVYI